MRLKDKICIVTGGAQGIGRAIVERFAEEGAKMIYSLDLNQGEYERDNVKHIQLNTTDHEGVKQLVETIIQEEGQIDVVVNNAGITRDALANKMTEEQWNIVIDVNMKAPHYMVAEVGPHMMAAGKGSIITISSIVGLYGNVGQVNYAATKAGVIAMTKTWTKELSRKGAVIRANAVAPGFISTPILQSMPEKIIDSMKAKILFNELGEPEDIANACLYLASDESKYVTGQVLEVSGGITI
ncbi:MAG: SDR family oxidoreductase [Clostridia bacterium]|nr:SDR family oxidoreductase [Clostridia bacterium]